MIFDLLYKMSGLIPGVNRIMRTIYGFDCPRRTKIGQNVKFLHKGLGTVINPNAIIDDNVTIQHHVTIGTNKIGGKVPKIGKNVEIGAYAIIIGDVNVGDNSIIGAGAIVTKDIPENSIYYNRRDAVLKRK